MGLNAIKLELIEWLTKLEDSETLNYLKIVKDSNESEKDWWHELHESANYDFFRCQPIIHD